MTLVADESVDLPIVIRLREDGHTVWYVAEMQPGLPDDAVLDLSNQYAAPLVTVDKGFGESVFHQKRITSGVILIRLAGLLPETKTEIVATFEVHRDRKKVARHTRNLCYNRKELFRRREGV